MKAKKVISRDILPANLPINSTVVYALALDYWSAPQWLWGVIGVILLVAWIGAISLILREEHIDLFDRLNKSN